MPEISVEIDAEPEVVFSYLTESDKLTQWQTMLTQAKNASGTTLDIGTRFENTLDVGKRFPQAKMVLGQTQLQMQGKVIAYEANRCLKIEGESSFNAFVIEYTCIPRPLPDGRTATRLSQDAEFKFKGLLLKQFAPLIQQMLVKQAEHDLSELKRIIELEKR